LPELAAGFERLASFSRLILFDKRGTGMSDPVPADQLPTLEQRMDDVRVVMDAVDCERAAIFGASEGGNMSMVFAATYPERTIALCTFGCTAKRIWSPDYPWAPTTEKRLRHSPRPSATGRPGSAGTKWPQALIRQAWPISPATTAGAPAPGAAVALLKMNTDVDVRDVLPTIRVPTVVMHRTADRDANVEEGRFIAAQLPGARFVEFPGADHSWWTQGRDAILDRSRARDRRQACAAAEPRARHGPGH
jgi:pimeloyl-ACP methyl ester carboxylesterase